MTYLE